jgi:hypothetical protein
MKSTLTDEEEEKSKMSEKAKDPVFNVNNEIEQIEKLSRIIVSLLANVDQLTSQDGPSIGAVFSSGDLFRKFKNKMGLTLLNSVEAMEEMLNQTKKALGMQVHK